MQQIWQVPPERRAELHRIKTELLLYYFDHEWNVAWGECQGMPTYLPLADVPMSLEAGQRIALDGVISPQRDRVVWDQTQVRIIESNVKLSPKAVQGRE